MSTRLLTRRRERGEPMAVNYAEHLTALGHQLEHLGLEDLQEVAEILEGLRPEITISVEASGLRPSQPPPGTQELSDKFLAAKQGKLRPDSITSYSAILRPFARAYSKLPLDPEQIESYLDNFSHEKTSAQYKFSVLRTFYLWLSRRNLIAVNPIKMVEKPGGQADEVLPLNEEQVRALHGMPKTDREQGYIGLMLGHGFRLSEVIRLDVGDIHEDRIWVHGKERKEWYPLLSEVREWLLKLADGRGPGEPLFLGRQGRLSDSQIQFDIKRLLQRACIRCVRQSPHTLRHTFSTLAYLAGCDWDSVELLLRQKEKRRNVTNRYIHLSSEQRLNLLRERLERYGPLKIVAGSELGEMLDFAQLVTNTGNVRETFTTPAEPGSKGRLSLTRGSKHPDFNPVRPLPDPAQLPELLDQMIALGEMTHGFKRALGGNGHWPEQVEELLAEVQLQIPKEQLPLWR